MNSLEQKQMYRANCEDVLIREAFVKSNYLTVTNKSGRTVCVSFDQIPALKAIRECDRKHFTIQVNGSCLHWEHSDTHLDFESFLYYVDDAFRQKCDEQKARYYREYGKAIAIVRTVYQVSIDAITGLKVEDVQCIESGALHPNSTALTYYADALGLSLDEFLDKVATNVDVLKAMEGM